MSATNTTVRRLAKAICNRGYDAWLDVWDPILGEEELAKDRCAMITALIIEMGLINSEGVIALMTDGAHGSSWIPYEFGRVKKGGPFAQMASVCCWDNSEPLQEYMLLSPHLEFRYPNQFDCLFNWLSAL